MRILLIVLIVFTFASSHAQYAFIDYKDTTALWRKMVWRVLPLDSVKNKSLQLVRDPEKNTFSLTDVLVKHISNGELQALRTLDTPAVLLSNEQVVAIADSTCKDSSYRVTHYMIFEEWTLYPAQNKMVLRIKGIAPAHVMETGKYKVLFWVPYYPLRGILKNYTLRLKVSRGKKFSVRDFFDGRYFHSQIVKTDILILAR